MQRWSAGGIALALLFISWPGSAEESPPAFQTGQEWTIKATPPSAVRVVIGRVEAWNGRKAVSVSILNVPCPAQSSCTTTTIAHAPFDEAALTKSVDRLVATDVAPSPDFERGYAYWKSHNGGVFTVDVATMVSRTSTTMTSGRPSTAE
jgi:hypothetical protein